jgi:hypothetical protein
MNETQTTKPDGAPSELSPRARELYAPLVKTFRTAYETERTSPTFRRETFLVQFCYLALRLAAKIALDLGWSRDKFVSLVGRAFEERSAKQPLGRKEQGP